MSLAPIGLPNVLPADVLAELKETAKMLCAPGTSHQREGESERESDDHLESKQPTVLHESHHVLHVPMVLEYQLVTIL